MLREVADGVLVHSSTLLRNNTVVVVAPSGALVVDPGLTEAELTCLVRDLAERGLPVVAGFATHPDWDHVLWHPDLGDVPRYGTRLCRQVMGDLRADPRWRARAAESLPEEIAGDVPLDLFGLIDPLPAGATTIPWDGPRVEIVEHLAHAPGHAALLVPGSRTLVAGDMLSDLFVPMLDDPDVSEDPVAEYLAGLDALATVADRVDVVVPGHGSVGTGAALRERVAADRAYVLALRDGRVPEDRRLGAPDPGWEWVADIHAGQAARFGPRRLHAAAG